MVVFTIVDATSSVGRACFSSASRAFATFLLDKYLAVVSIRRLTWWSHGEDKRRVEHACRARVPGKHWFFEAFFCDNFLRHLQMLIILRILYCVFDGHIVLTFAHGISSSNCSFIPLGSESLNAARKSFSKFLNASHALRLAGTSTLPGDRGIRLVN